MYRTKRNRLGIRPWKKPRFISQLEWSEITETGDPIQVWNFLEDNFHIKQFMELEDNDIASFLSPDTIKYWFNVAILLFGLRNGSGRHLLATIDSKLVVRIRKNSKMLPNYEFARRLFLRIKKKCKRCKAIELKDTCQLFLDKADDGALYVRTPQRLYGTDLINACSSSYYTTIGNGGNTSIGAGILRSATKTFVAKNVTKSSLKSFSMHKRSVLHDQVTKNWKNLFQTSSPS